MGRGLEKRGSSARGVGVVGAEEQRMSRGGGTVAQEGGGLRRRPVFFQLFVPTSLGVVFYKEAIFECGMCLEAPRYQLE